VHVFNVVLMFICLLRYGPVDISMKATDTDPGYMNAIRHIAYKNIPATEDPRTMKKLLPWGPPSSLYDSPISILFLLCMILHFSKLTC
jgi:hypothetical protein